MRQDTSERNRRSDERVQFLVTSDRELKMTRGYALHFEVFGGVAGQFEDFGCEVFEHGGDVDGGCKQALVSEGRLEERDALRGGEGEGTFGADAHFVLGVVLEKTLDTAAGELQDGKLV